MHAFVQLDVGSNRERAEVVVLGLSGMKGNDIGSTHIDVFGVLGFPSVVVAGTMVFEKTDGR